MAVLVPDLIEGALGMKFVPDKSIEGMTTADFDAAVCPGARANDNPSRRERF